MSEPTARPWIIRWSGNIFGAGGERLVANTASRQSNVRDENPENAANAEFIVRAVNAHEDLVAALRTAERELSTIASNRGYDSDALIAIRAALAKARGTDTAAMAAGEAER